MAAKDYREKPCQVQFSPKKPAAGKQNTGEVEFIKITKKMDHLDKFEVIKFEFGHAPLG